MNSEKAIDFTPLLKETIIKIKPKGYSMYPLFVPGRDYAVIDQADTSRLKKGDVILYRRTDSILVLHRIARITPEGIFTVGDNQTELEGPLLKEQVKGILIRVVRNGHEFSVKNPIYKVLSFLWLTLRPVRRPISLFIAKIKRVL